MRNKREKGFTLVELVIALAMGVILLGAIYQVVQTGMRSSSSMEKKVTAGQDVRAALELMAMEIRMASFNPAFTTGMWKNADGSISAYQNNKGIQDAADFSILIEMDLNADSTIDTTSSEAILYSLDTANKYITRTAGAGAQPFLGANPATTQERTVRVINSDLNIPIFTYYDGKGVQLSVSNFPASIVNIRRIEIVLAVETDDVDPNSGQRKRIIYSTSVIPRNHAASE
jgi:type IV pilus assembly protein PilW